VIEVEPQLARQQQRRAIPNDPFFSGQWHLNNTGQGGGEPAIDVNVLNVWNNYRGAGVVIGIVDDGLEKSHPDLAPNYSAALSYDFNFNDPNPEPPPFSFDDHGTACAGVAGARGNNGIGVSGAAFQATLSGLRLISRPSSDADEAEAFHFQDQAIDIKSNSWGPSDNGKTLDRPGPLTRAAFEDAVATGRGGLGTIIVWLVGMAWTGETTPTTTVTPMHRRPSPSAQSATTVFSPTIPKLARTLW
jgi:subtilisin family serine protease